MKKIVVGVLSTLLLVGVFAGSVSAEMEHGDKPEFKEVKLTDQQLAELKTIYEDLINQRKGLINKYEEFGVLSAEDAANMKEHLDMFFAKMEEDGFIPKWDKHHKKNEE